MLWLILRQMKKIVAIKENTKLINQKVTPIKKSVEIDGVFGKTKVFPPDGYLFVEINDAKAIRDEQRQLELLKLDKGIDIPSVIKNSKNIDMVVAVNKNQEKTIESLEKQNKTLKNDMAKIVEPLKKELKLTNSKLEISEKKNKDLEATNKDLLDEIAELKADDISGVGD